MGRWSQRRLRGGSPGSAPPPPAGVAIVSVATTFLGGAYDVTFASAVAFTSGSFPGDIGLTIDGLAVQAVSLSPSSPGTVVNVQVSGSPGAGQPWAVAGQPAWLTDAILIPQSGTIT